jgi:hypothetical protein
MFSASVYKIVHFLGIFMLFMSIGGILVNSIAREERVREWRKALNITHGVGLLLILLGGFGQLARLGILWPLPGWVILKLIIWVMLGGLIALVLQSNLSKLLWILVIFLGTIAAYLAIMKPF